MWTFRLLHSQVLRRHRPAAARSSSTDAVERKKTGHELSTIHIAWNHDGTGWMWRRNRRDNIRNDSGSQGGGGSTNHDRYIPGANSTTCDAGQRAYACTAVCRSRNLFLVRGFTG